MNLILTRVCTSDKGTFGVLSLDNIPIATTCEDPWNDNQRNISCIPAGTYECKEHNGVRYIHVWEITNVPDRSAILIHSGNSTSDTMGCVLTGNGYGTLRINGTPETPAVINSLDTLNFLRKILPKSFTLTIREAYAN